MIRITYNFGGFIYEEIINPKTTGITKEMLGAITEVYVFRTGKLLKGDKAKLFAARVSRDWNDMPGEWKVEDKNRNAVTVK